MLHMERYRPADARILVMDDASTSPPEARPSASYIHSPKRLGVARAKNRCIQAMPEVDWLFLFDDDAWPNKDGWADAFVDAAVKSGQDVLSYQTTLNQVQMISTDGLTEVYNNGWGVMVMLSRKAINVLGGFDPNFGLWGFEHGQLCERAHRAGLCNGSPYVTVVNARQWIYAMDCYGGRSNPPTCSTLDFEFDSTMSETEKRQEQEIGRPRLLVRDIHFDIYEKDHVHDAELSEGPGLPGPGSGASVDLVLHAGRGAGGIVYEA